jgi:hypothetical protein
MAQDPTSASMQMLYKWLFDESPTLQKKRAAGDKLTPDLQLWAYPNGLTYDVTVRFFIEEPVSVPMTLLPANYVQTFAKMVESKDRTRTFSTVKPAVSGSGVVVFSDFVWNDTLLMTYGGK